VDATPNSSAVPRLDRHRERTYTLFEGTSEIQRLVVARAVSGLHIP
jgi:alkylation response protein AidB-like acyl-CoA dehydrogenase